MEQTPSPEQVLKFTREKYLKETRMCVPLFSLFEITNKCNLHCKYPMMDCKCCGLDSQVGEYELSRDEVYSIISNISRGGTKSLSFIGGEPTLRKDLPQIVAYAARSMDVAIVTNGVLLDKDYVLLLKQAGVSWIKVYVDSPGAELHDSIRGQGTHQRAIEALHHCREAGIKTSVINAVSPLNYRALREMMRLALELRAIIEATEFLPCGEGDDQLLLTKGQRREVQEHLLEAQKFLGRQTVRFAKYYISGEDDDGLRRWTDPSKEDCNVGYPWGMYGYGIKADGRMVPDPLITLELGDLRKQSMKEIWDRSLTLKNLRYRGKLKGKCARCEYRFICGGHRGRTYSITGDFMDEDPACWYEPSLA